jgi:hypothetical protein
MKANVEFLQTHIEGDNVCIISDFRRWTPDKWDRLEEFIEYFKDRKRPFKEIPILVYTSNIIQGAFFNDLPCTSSTTSQVVVRQYIDGLAKGDRNWNPGHR